MASFRRIAIIQWHIKVCDGHRLSCSEVIRIVISFGVENDL